MSEKQTPEQFYKDETAALASREHSLTRKSNALVACKLILFCGIVAAIWYTAKTGGSTPGIMLTATAAILYIAAVKADAILDKRAKCLRSQRKVCENESAYLRNDFSPFDDGAEFVDIQHEYSYDLDIFGPESLFNRINRTVTQKGKENLARRLTQLPTGKDTIIRNQEAIKELAEIPLWRIRFSSHEHIGKNLDKLSEGVGNLNGKGGKRIKAHSSGQSACHSSLRQTGLLFAPAGSHSSRCRCFQACAQRTTLRKRYPIFRLNC